VSVTLTASDEKLDEQFRNLKTPRDLAALLDIKYSHLTYHAYIAKGDKRYHTFTIRKKSGGVRQIQSPSVGLRIIQRKLNQILKYIYQCPPSVHGFVPKYNICSNARVHVKQKYVLNVDIEDFFPSINFGRVRGLFQARPYSLPDEVATILAQLCCHDRQLPQGAPTSPIISNMIRAKMDRALYNLAEEFYCNYTRYADDLTFSTRSREFPIELAYYREDGKLDIEIGEKLTNIIQDNGFQINASKVRLNKSSQHQEVTGLTVNQFPNVKRSYVRQIRAMLHAWDKYGLELAEREFRTVHAHSHRHSASSYTSFQSVLGGKIEFVGAVKGKKHPVYVQLYNKYKGLMEMATPPPEIKESLAKFRLDYPDAKSVVFIMMRFGNTKAHGQIVTTISDSLQTHGLIALQADTKYYHSDLYYNILTYLWGCYSGIAVFERIEQDDFNPNVAFELGYAFALNKPVCLLKDKNLQSLHADLAGKLYRPFDTQNIKATLTSELNKWIVDNSLGSPSKP
jgi:RNA-directed DNA polymerase